MSNIDSLVEVYNKVLEGRSINAVVGDWEVSNVGCKTTITFLSKDVVYGFGIGVIDGDVQFFNYHREAKKGTGTPTLKEIESSFIALAKNRNQKVVSAFDLAGQKDTEAWLKKNGYTQHEGNIYYKTFEVPSNQSN